MRVVPVNNTLNGRLMFRESKSFADQSACVADVAKLCMATIDDFGYSSHDARWVALNNIATVAKASQLVLNLLDSWCIGDETVRSFIPQVVGIQPVTPEAVKAGGEWLNGNSRLGFLLLSQFQIENLLRNLCRELALPLPQGFFSLATGILERLNLRSDLSTLNVLALLRNSLHNNGIHDGYRGSSTSVQIGPVRYDFIHGQRVTCANWEHVANALEASIGVLKRVLSHAAVIAIPDPMMDQYAWERLTEPAP